jgi:tetratricopeptide (TPR) repeat protein/predicted Ser/Thr protein kinase
VISSEAARSAAVAATKIEAGYTFVDEPERYLVEREIGAGGMGRVLAARGERFGRRVAVKLITLDRDDLRRRFEREAQITARLQHPAIVPVYGSGNGDGRPFYAMKQVTGEPLSAVLARGGSLADRIALLPTAIAVSEAIAYAHAERVIHRDLKPANILVGAFGETVIIDWGLAKDLADSDRDDAGETDGGTPYRADETAAGRVMGTPAYMPPEQARGERVDERADVYALGAILYYLLAGAPPYARADEGSVPWESMLARVLSAAPPPIESLQPTVPPDLAAIVRRAMARAPADRYPTARQLAEDLRKFQTGQLVGAHRYSTWQLVKRWIRRRRAPLGVAAIALVALAALGALSIRRIVVEQERTEDQRMAAEEQRALADKNRASAESLLSFMLGDLRGKLEPLGKTDLLDDVAKKAVAYYADRGEPTDAELPGRAQVAANLASVLLPQGHTKEAIEQFELAIAMQRRVVAQHPDDPKAASQLSKLLINEGVVKLAQGDPSGALALYREAAAMRDKLAAAAPADMDLQIDVATSRSRIAEVLVAQGDAPGATAAQSEANAAYERVVAAGGPTADKAQRQLAVGRAMLGAYLQTQGKMADAKAALEKSLDLMNQRLAAAPTDARRIADQSNAVTMLADLLMAMGDLDGALARYRELLVDDEAVARRDPTNTKARHDVGMGHVRIASALADKGLAREALAEDKLGYDIVAATVAADPANLDWVYHQSIIAEKLGDAELALADYAPAVAQQRTSLKLRGDLVSKKPGNLTWVYAAAVAHGKVAEALGHTHDLDAEETELRAELATISPLLAKDPTDANYIDTAVQAHEGLADVMRDRGRGADAVVEARADLALVEPLAAADPGIAKWQQALADAYNEVGMSLAAAGDAHGALDAYRRCIAAADRGLTGVTITPRLADDYDARAKRLGDALTKAGDAAGAKAAYDASAAIRARVGK